eukprot:2419418-Karenia_brevis.AAC.1
MQTNKWETLRDEDEDEDEDGDDEDSLACPAIASSSEDENPGMPNIQELRDLQLVTRRKRRFEKPKQIKKIKFRECNCNDRDCDRDRWIQQ